MSIRKAILNDTGGGTIHLYIEDGEAQFDTFDEDGEPATMIGLGLTRGDLELALQMLDEAEDA